jgi:hypothetical protein
MNKERKGCRLLKLRAIPHVGKLPDRVAPAVTIMKPVSKVDLNLLPLKAKTAVNAFMGKYPEGQLDFFVVNVNAESFKNNISTQSLTLDYILHPYSMNNYHAEQDKVIDVNVSLYRLNELDPIYNIKDGIEIDADDLFNKSCQRTIGIKDKGGKIEMSKEGISFVMTCHYPILSFFGLSIHSIKDRPTLLISL